MKISAAFPSAYLKASDLNGQRVRIKMHRVVMEDVGDDHKPVLYFYGTEKKMVLNKTNANEIGSAYGEDTEYWDGQLIEIYPARVDFAGRKVDAIRVNAFLGNRTAAPVAATAAQAPLPQPAPPPQQRAPAVFNGAVSDFPGDNPLPVAGQTDPFLDDKIPF
jgi:hypothetical protein